jgi:hypothetical protein
VSVVLLSQLLAKYKKISVVCHDSGGANVLNCLEKSIDRDILYYGFGPAKEIFGRKCRSLDAELLKSDLVLTGTSGTSNAELDIISMARANGIATMSFLEHWTNYLTRFKRGDRLVLPDQILVGDLYAKELAIQTFGSDKVVHVNNPYLEHLLERAKHFEGSVLKSSLLYLGDTFDLPTQDREIQDSDGILHSFLKRFTERFEISIINIRPHPSENKKNTFQSLRIEGIEVKFSSNDDLLTDILQHQYIAGYETMALFIASHFKTEVFSSKPLSNGRTNLPTKKIVQF